MLLYHWSWLILSWKTATWNIARLWKTTWMWKTSSPLATSFFSQQIDASHIGWFAQVLLHFNVSFLRCPSVQRRHRFLLIARHGCWTGVPNRRPAALRWPPVAAASTPPVEAKSSGSHGQFLLTWSSRKFLRTSSHKRDWTVGCEAVCRNTGIAHGHVEGTHFRRLLSPQYPKHIHIYQHDPHGTSTMILGITNIPFKTPWVALLAPGSSLLKELRSKTSRFVVCNSFGSGIKKCQK